jgi:hypothetical protein
MSSVGAADAAVAARRVSTIPKLVFMKVPRMLFSPVKHHRISLISYKQQR